jgi:uncharacterized protein (TIGR04222 family)
MSWNPLDWPAGPFLTLYLAVAVVVFLWGFYDRSIIGPSARLTQKLNPFELAFLAGGARRLGDAVLLSLTSGHGATITEKGDKITVTSQAPISAMMGRTQLLSVQPDMTRQQFQKAVKPVAEQVQSRLQEFGYCPTDDQMNAFRISTLPFVAILLALGITKAFVGAERHHPVGFLIILRRERAPARRCCRPIRPRTRGRRARRSTTNSSSPSHSPAPSSCREPPMRRSMRPRRR